MNLSLFALLLLISLFLATAVSQLSALQSESSSGNNFRLLATGEKETSLRNNNVQTQDGDEGDKINEDIKKSGGGGHGRGAGGGAGGNGNHHGLNRRKNGASTRSGPLNFALTLSFVCAYMLSACPVR